MPTPLRSDRDGANVAAVVQIVTGTSEDTQPAQEVARVVAEVAQRAKAAARVVAQLPTTKKDAVLRRAAAGLRGPHLQEILAANAEDCAAARARGLAPAMLDRLRLDRARIEAMAGAIEHIVTLPDPVGEVAEQRRLPNGLTVGRMRVPLGLIAIVYEARPNVTSDAAALCLKSGNACVLRGGSEAVRSNHAIATVFAEALAAEGVPAAAVSLLPTTEREATLALLRQVGVVDLAIPRGGESLIRFVTENARVPVIQHYKGVCHLYVDADSDPEMAEAVALNSKVQRPGVCNALETLLVDRACAPTFVPRVVAAMRAQGVEVRGDVAVRALVADVTKATPADWDTEYLDLVLSVAIVDGLDGALAHIARHGTFHTEVIVTRSYANAQRFLREVDASLVLVNASTRFNDGSELGLGAEIGISTTKMHAYGPMGLRELCTQKWIGYGDGQVRG
jgi:glutamate-5-semialdehyde dehydrogenase